MPEQGPQGRQNRENPADAAAFDREFAAGALRHGFVTISQIEDALSAQRAILALGMKRGLAEILVEKGLVTEVQADGVRRAVETGGEARIVGGFELIEKLGEGAMGVVYRARQMSLDRTVALKILSERLARDRDFVARFQREARVVAKLDHVNIVRALDVGEAEGVRYFAMEFVEGRDVGSILDEKGRMPEPEALHITIQVARALEHARRNSLIHRDVKPDNILVTADGVAKLADLGLARSTDERAARVTATGMAMGTPHYISPEQARGVADVDIRTDIYSLGVTLYHMLAGEPPFAGSSAAVILTRRLTEDAPWIRERAGDVSEGTALVVRKMMAREREERYATPAELIRDLEFVADGKMPALAAPDEHTVLWSSASLRKPGREPLPADREVRGPQIEEAKAKKRRASPAAIAGGVLALLALAAAAVFLVIERPWAGRDGVGRELRAGAERRMAEVDALARQGNLDGAIRAAEAATESFAGTPLAASFSERRADLVEAKRKAARDAEAADALAGIVALREAGKLNEALERAAAAKERYAGTSGGDEIARLHEELHGLILAKEKLDETLGIVADLEGAGALDRALERARAARDELAGTGLAGALDEAVARLEGKIRAREAEKEARERLNADARAELGVIERLFERKEYETAVSRGEKASRKYQGTRCSKRIKSLLADARKALGEVRAASARFEAHMTAAEDAVEERRYADAVAAYKKALAVRKSGEAERALKEAGYQAHLARSREAEKAGELGRAIDEVRAAMSITPSRAAASRLEDLERRGRLQGVLAKARSHEAAGNFERAREVYRRALADAGPAGRLAIGKALDRTEREIAYATALEEANTHAAAGRWADAGRAAERALRVKRGDATAKALLASVRRGMEADREKPAPVPEPAAEPGGEPERKSEKEPEAMPARGGQEGRLPPLESVPGEERGGKVGPLPPIDAPARAGALPPIESLPRPLRRPAYRTVRTMNRIGMAFVLVPRGEYKVGDALGQPDEQPVRRVTLDAFFMGVHEVTNLQYEQYDRRHRKKRSEFSPGDDHPAVGFTWTEAQRFCTWLTRREGVVFRLPTEAEWEVAARGRDGRRYPWGDEAADAGGVFRANWGQGDDERAWARDGFRSAAPVGSFPAGASPFGCLDMAGNVWEWCFDWYDAAAYASPKKENPTGPRRGKEKVVRGGSYSTDIEIARCSNRHKADMKTKNPSVGFRVVREVHPKKDKEILDRLSR